MDSRLELVIRVLFVLLTARRRSCVEYSDTVDEVRRNQDDQSKTRIVGVGPPPPTSSTT